MHAKDPTKLRVRDLQPMVRKYLPVPYHEVSLTVFVLEYGAEESAAFQVTPPYLTLCFSSSFLFNVVVIHHFNMVNTLYRVQVFVDLDECP